MLGIDYWPFGKLPVQENDQAAAAIGDFMLIMILWGIIHWVIFLITINLIPWEPGRNPRDPGKRRRAFYIFILTLLATDLAIMWGSAGVFEKARHLSDFYGTVAWLGPLLILGFVGINYGLGKFFFPASKLGSIFGGGRNRPN